MEFLFLILLSAILIFFGISALKSDKKSKTNIYFFLFIVCAVIWFFSNYFSNVVSDYQTALLANRFIFVSTTVLVWILFLFASVYPESESVISKRSENISAAFTAIVALLGFSKYIVEDIALEEGYSSIKFGPGMIIYILHLIIFFLLFVYIFVKKYKKFTGIEKVRLQYLLLGVVFSMIGVSITNLILPVFFDVFYLSDYGPAFLLIFVGFVFFSIVKHRLFGIRFLLGRIFFLMLISIFTALSFFFFSYIAQLFFKGPFTTGSILISFVIAPIYSFIFLWFSKFIQDWIEKKFVYTQSHPAEILSKFLKQTSTELDMDKIAVYTINTVRKFLDLEKVGILLFDKDNSKVLYKKLIGFELRGIRDLLQVINYWQDIGEDPVMVLDEVKKLNKRNEKDVKNRLDRIIQCMEREGIAVILPLNRKVQLNGILVIGNKKSSAPFSVEDLKFLEDIIANTSVAMGRAILYKEVESLNSTLEARVAEQTKDLKKKVQQLDEARQREHDMVDIMGHELRTPITVVKNYYQLMENLFKTNTIEDKTVAKKYKEYLKVINENIEKEISLINVLLSATKLDNNHIELNREAVDIIDMLEDGISAHIDSAKEKGLYIKYYKPQNVKKFPKVYGDKIRIHEIIDNLTSNSIKYTNKGGVKIKVSHDKKFAKIDISDTGIGMSKEDLKNIGKKFYRSNQYLNNKGKNIQLVRPGGSGLGLFVTFGLIKAHGGTVKVKSKLGKGSTFSFTLPLVKRVDKVQGSVSKYNGDMFEKLGLKK